ncbi:MAG TPA: hypothetical protein VMJ34_16290 [Bryobacteraceae bacterium]|nr:hypothetical protein [Bryobacteraceae bacterium]
MSESESGEQTAQKAPGDELRDIIRSAIEEYVRAEQANSEPAYKTELVEERKRREQLERRVNELAAENERSRAAAERAERDAVLRAELQRLGVNKVDLAFRAVKEDIRRAEDGRIVARSDGGEVGLREYLSQFVNENPELLPARIAGGSGMESIPRPAIGAGGVDLDRIHPGMAPEELQRARQEIARLASQTLKGL